MVSWEKANANTAEDTGCLEPEPTALAAASRTHPQDVRPQLGPGEGVKTFWEVARKSLSQVQRAGAGGELSISGCYCRGREPPRCGYLAAPVRSTQE